MTFLLAAAGMLLLTAQPAYSYDKHDLTWWVNKLHGIEEAHRDYSCVECDLSEINFNKRVCADNGKCIDVGLLKSSDFSKANLRSVILSDRNLSDIRFTGADLSRAQLGYCNIMGSDFTGANLEGINLEDAVILEALLAKTNLENTISWWGQRWKATRGRKGRREKRGHRGRKARRDRKGRRVIRARQEPRDRLELMEPTEQQGRKGLRVTKVTRVIREIPEIRDRLGPMVYLDMKEWS